MEILEYKIQKGDTLESIAEMHGISVKELVDFHNRNCGATQQILWNKIPIHVTLLFINKKENSNEPIETNYFPDDESTARYRCEQADDRNGDRRKRRKWTVYLRACPAFPHRERISLQCGAIPNLCDA